MIFNFKKAEVQALLQSSEPKSMQIKTQTFEGAQVHIKGLSPYQKFGVGESLLGGGFFQMCLCVGGGGGGGGGGGEGDEEIFGWWWGTHQAKILLQGKEQVDPKMFDAQAKPEKVY